jgi:hypothetical protein
MSDASNVGMRDSMPGAGAAAVDLTDDPGHEPPADRPRDRTAWQFRVQARSCAEMGSPLYGHLLERAAEDCAAGGPTWEALATHAGSGRADALALRFMAAVHGLVLEGQAAELAAHYPSAGGTASLDGAWDAFHHTLTRNAHTVTRLAHRPCQTNEVGRSAALAVGFLHVMHQTGLPLRLLEVGASAGLNLRVDGFHIGGGGVAVGDPDSPVDLSDQWTVPPPHDTDRIEVVSRRGCDRDPVDPTTAEGALALTSSVWADQRARLDRLRGAIELARRCPAEVDRASLDVWTERQVRALPVGCATVVFHSVVSEYLSDATRERFVAAVRDAGARATHARPFAWLRLEPISMLRHHGVELTLWPGGETRTLARCGAHGADVEWLGDTPDTSRGGP